MPLKAKSNIAFFSPFLSEVAPGVRVRQLWNSAVKRKVPAIHLGGFVQKSKGKAPTPRKGSVQLWSHSDLQPTIENGKFIGGGILRVPTKGGRGERRFLSARVDGYGNYVVTTRTGLRAIEGDTMNHLTSLLAGGTRLVPHGVFSLGGAKSVESVSLGGGEEIPEAKRVRWFVKKAQNFPSADGSQVYVPAYRYDVWELPVGGELLVRDIDGTIVRLVARPDRLDVVDAPDNGHQVFDDLEAARVARLRKKS